MASRLSTDEEVESWRRQGWVLLEGLVDPTEIDAAQEDLHKIFPRNDEYRADPEGMTEQRKGRPPPRHEDFVWPEDSPGFRDEQQLWSAKFPFPGGGILNQLCVHPSIVDFAERALGSQTIRLYQIHATAKYEGITNYEQPLHMDRNHSWLPASHRAPWWNLEGFLYLNDVTEEENPTHLVSVQHTRELSEQHPIVMPDTNPELYAAERAAPGVRGSYLAYRSDVFHRGTAFSQPNTYRIVLALAFRDADHEWIGYDEAQSRSTEVAWIRFAERCTPRQLELFGFPPPGHKIWDEELLAETQIRYPLMDLGPWREALGVSD